MNSSLQLLASYSHTSLSLVKKRKMFLSISKRNVVFAFANRGELSCLNITSLPTTFFIPFSLGTDNLLVLPYKENRVGTSTHPG